jgi:hypothetical protein
VGRDIFARFLPDIPSAVGIFAPDLTYLAKNQWAMVLDQ